MKANREDLLEKLPDLYEGYRLCENHFEEKMFTSHLHTRLVANALPTLFPSLEGSSRTGMAVMGEHSYNAPPLYSAKIRILQLSENESKISHPGIQLFGACRDELLCKIWIPSSRSNRYC